MCVTKTFQNTLVLKILNEGFIVNKLSISVISPSIDFEPPENIFALYQADINCGTAGPAVPGQFSVARPKALESKINLC